MIDKLLAPLGEMIERITVPGEHQVNVRSETDSSVKRAQKAFEQPALTQVPAADVGSNRGKHVVSRKQLPTELETDRTGGMPGRVQHLKFATTCVDPLAVHQPRGSRGLDGQGQACRVLWLLHHIISYVPLGQAICHQVLETNAVGVDVGNRLHFTLVNQDFRI